MIKDLLKGVGFFPNLNQEIVFLQTARGFNIQELLLPYRVNLAIHPFLKKKKQFSLEEDARTKQVANARIHIERVIGRVQDFDILKSELPLDMFDLFDHVAVVI